MWERAGRKGCVAFSRWGESRSADRIAFFVPTTASGSSGRCRDGCGFRPADLSVDVGYGAFSRITYFVDIHPRELFVKIRHVVHYAVQRVTMF